MENFFKPKSCKRKVDVVNLTDESVPSTPPPPPPKKVYAKRKSTTGFTEANVHSKLVSMTEKKTAEGSWLKFDMMTITSTKVEIKWTFEGKSTLVNHFAPWGMKDFIKKKQTSAVTFPSFEVLPAQV